MRKIIILTLILISVLSFKPGSEWIKVNNLRCEYFVCPLGIDSKSPKLSWEIKSAEFGISQSAYHIMVADNRDVLTRGTGNVWDSKKTESDHSIQVPYAGIPLKAGKTYYWKVKIWDQLGHESEWSKISFWQMGLLHPGDWNDARWIGYERLADSMRIVPGVQGSGNQLGWKGKQRPIVPLFRKDFVLQKAIASATLFISGLGQYEAYLNGAKIGNGFLTPGWTDYDKTVFYNTYDVKAFLKKGDNAIGVIVGNGFYNIDRERYRKLVIAYGMPKMICKLVVTYDDGSVKTVISDEGWKTTPSPITYSSIYGGEDYDARLEQEGWNKPNFDDSGWKEVLMVRHPSGKMKADMDYPLGVKKILYPKNIQKLAEGSCLYDFGQNASGIIKLKVKGKKGQQVRLIPGELIDEDGKVNQRASGSPYFYTYTLRGDGIEVWQPRFTYYGFRYVQVKGAVPRSFDTHGEIPVIQGLNLLHTRNTTQQVGSFECSNELFNRIYTLILWAIKSNLQSVVTDCPHREKLGWMEQTYLMGEGIHFNFDIYHLYKKLVYDMMDAQTPDGLIPDIAPEYVLFNRGFRDSPEWGSAAVILPWLLYRWYDDQSVIENAWPMMVKYVEYLKRKSDHHILSYGLGDWFDLGPKRPGVAQLTPIALTATATYYYDVKLLGKMAGILKNTEEQKRFNKWAEEIKKAFNDQFFNARKKAYSTGSQTAMSIPLCFGLIDKQYEKQVLNNLIDSIHANENALTAGDIGFHYLVEALTKEGASQLLFRMINRDDVPGYGYQLKKGATSLTESWAALRNVSNNHLMLGHIMEWFYQGIGGIRQEVGSTGYKNIVICPEVVGDVTSAKTAFHTPYGVIKTAWEKTENLFILTVEIPVNTQAKVYLPISGEVSVNNGKQPKDRGPGYQYLGVNKGRMVFETGSGTYEFKIIPTGKSNQ